MIEMNAFKPRLDDVVAANNLAYEKDDKSDSSISQKLDEYEMISFSLD